MKGISLSIWLIIILLVFSSCGVKSDSTQAIPELKGIITEVNESSFSLLTNDNEPYVVHLDNELRFNEGVSKEFVVGNYVIVGFSGEVMESYPMQINAKLIVDNRLDDLIVLDEREEASGFVGGFPAMILSNSNEDENNAVVSIEDILAIKLEENPSTGYTWNYEIDSEFTKSTGDGFRDRVANKDLVGAPGDHYFGFEFVKEGETQIVFNQVSPSGEIVETISFEILIN